MNDGQKNRRPTVRTPRTMGHPTGRVVGYLGRLLKPCGGSVIENKTWGTRHLSTDMNDTEFVKVQFYDPVIGYENIWAAPLGDGNYRLENPPFFIYDISLNDTVAAMPNEDGLLQFLAVVRRSGNITLRARSTALIGNLVRRTEIENHLREHGCTVEEHRERLLAISVPPTAQLGNVTSYLTESGLSWEYGYPSEKNT